jgi:hypothetical protein
MVTLKINGEDHTVDVSPDMPLLWVLGSDRHQVRLRYGTVRRLYRARGRYADTVVCDAGIRRRRKEDHDYRGDWRNAERQEGAGSLVGSGSGPVWLLPVGPDHVRVRAAGESSGSHRWLLARQRVRRAAVEVGEVRGSLSARLCLGLRSQGRTRYLAFYNMHRPHSSLDRLTPDQFYFQSLPQPEAA